MDYRRETDAILKRSGAVLLRQRKHEVWRLPNGETLVRSSTPSDWHANENAYKDLVKKLRLPASGN